VIAELQKNQTDWGIVMKLKKRLSLILVLAILAGILPLYASAQTGITVTIDGAALSFDVPPQIINGRAMVPMRRIFDALGANVQWNGASRSITATSPNRTIVLHIDSTTMVVNGNIITLDVPPQIIGNRTLVPVRAVSEGMDANVRWVSDIKTVIITRRVVQTPDPAGLTFGWSVYDLANPFFIPMDEGVKAKAAELGITLLPTHDNKSSVTEMISGVTSLIEQGIDALVISPFGPEAMNTVMTMAKSAGIPVVVVDIGTGGAPVDAYVMSDYRGGGRLVGEYFLSIYDEFEKITSKNVAIIKVETSAIYARMRGEGFKDAVVPAGFTVVDEQHGNSSMDEAYAIMVDYIARFGNDLAAVFVENDWMALGAVKAIDEAGMSGQILVFGFDGMDEAIHAIRAGKMHGTAMRDSFGLGQTGVQLAYDIVSGKGISSNVTEQASGAPLFWSPMAMIGKDGALLP